MVLKEVDVVVILKVKDVKNMQILLITHKLWIIKRFNCDFVAVH